MSSDNHTPGPWKVQGTRIRSTSPGVDCIATMQVSNQPNWDADARRIVACVNSCIGLTTAVLESIVMVGDTIADRFAQRNLDESALMAQHKSLLADMELLVARAASRREGAVDTELIVAVMKKHGGAA